MNFKNIVWFIKAILLLLLIIIIIIIVIVNIIFIIKVPMKWKIIAAYWRFLK